MNDYTMKRLRMSEEAYYKRLIIEYDELATTQTITAMIKQKILKQKIIQQAKKLGWVSPWAPAEDYII